LSKILQRQSGYLTKGPYALFYGDTAIIPLLSSESAESYLLVACLVSVSLLLAIFVLKKVIMRKLPTQQRLKELVVSNFLNVFSLLIILVIGTLLTGAAVFHLQTINENSITSKTDNKKAPIDYWKDLLMIAAVETIVQLTPFIINPALR
jgi:hypothetical protein